MLLNNQTNTVFPRPLTTEKETNNIIDIHQLGMLIDHLDGMFYQGAVDDCWTFSFLSKGCQAITGYSAADLINNRRITFKSLVIEADYQTADAHIQEAIKAKKNFDIEYAIRHANGAIIWLSERGMPVFDAHGRLKMIQGFIQDITAHKNALYSLQQTEARYRSIFENAIEGIFQTSPEGQYLAVNPALANIYGYDSPKALINNLKDIQHELYVDSNRREEFIREMDLHGMVQNFESLVYKKDKSTIWVSENARKVFNATGELQYYEGMVEDITSRKQYESKIEYQANHDSLTGLPNRYLLNDRLQQNMRLCDRNQTSLAIAFLDLDHFKMINDTMSHEVGDKLLVLIAQRISETIRSVDTIARVGGDEFVILLANLTQTQDYKITIQRIIECIAQPCKIGHQEFNISCSIGISLYPAHAQHAGELLRNADLALYEAKRLGRNNDQLYTPSLNNILIERVKTEQNLRVAIVKKEFLLHYQPKVCFKTGKVVGAEALIRWQTADGKMIPPIQFIDIAEETGLILEIGEWVLREACQVASAWNQQRHTPISIAVNVSHKQFKDERFLPRLENILQTSGLDPQWLELEITESLAAENVTSFIEKLNALKKLGVKLAIDDFGTGYSSLAYLKNFPVDCLKIDKAFVSKLESEHTNGAILKAIIVLGQSLGMEIVAEGVETEHQRDYLHAIGCDIYQGYLFSKPIPEQAFLTLLTNPS